MAAMKYENGEVEILHARNVSHGAFEHKYNEEFYLTNMHLYCVTRSFFGKIKSMDSFVISEIAIDENGDSKIILDGNHANGGPKLQIFFGNIPYFFYFLDKNVATEWGNTISQMRTGKKMKNMTVEMITKAIKGIKTVIENELRKPATGKCNSCGASISGYQGEMMTCPFCNNKQIM